MTENILEVHHLKQYFPVSRQEVVKAIDDVSFNIEKGETFGLVGESGSGKTTIGRAIIRLHDPTEGKVIFQGKTISGKLNKKSQEMLRSDMQMIFQDPMSSLNPRKKISDIIKVGLDIHRRDLREPEKMKLVYEVLRTVGLDESFAVRYPKELSGGQRQRIGIARAVVMNPQLIIADEAISALDVSVQAQVVNLLKQIQKDTGSALLFIAHDLAMVRHISDHIGVIHLGHLIELGTTEQIFENPYHSYTKSLLESIPVANPVTERGKQPTTYSATKADYENQSMVEVETGHWVLTEKQ